MRLKSVSLLSLIRRCVLMLMVPTLVPMGFAQSLIEAAEQARLMPFVSASDAREDAREDGLSFAPVPRSASMLFAPSLDEPGFVLDRSQERALFRQSGDFEVVSLRGRTGARGDVFLRDDTGRLVFRLTDLGGMTYYSSRSRMGEPVMPVDTTHPISPPVRPENLEADLRALIGDHAEQTGQILSIEIDPDLTVESEWVLDAARLALRALTSVQGRQGRAEAIKIVAFMRAGRARLAIEGDTLIVPVNPALGYDGRPSSRAIARVLSQPVR